MRPKSVISLIHSQAAGRAVIDRWIVQRTSGDAAVLVRAHRRKVADCHGQFGGAGLADNLCLGELQQVSDAYVWIVLNGDTFGVAQG